MLSEYEQKIIDNVEEYGWFGVGVFGGSGPEFSYSVGFSQTLNVPELIVFGLPLKLMHSMLWAAFRQIKGGKNIVRDGQRWSDLIDGFDCISRPVHESRIVRDYFNSAIWFHKHSGSAQPLQAFQLFWPAATTGLFPWEKGCSESVRELQPSLYLPDSAGIA